MPFVFWVMPLHFCPKRDISLSQTRSIQRLLFYFLPLKSFHRLAKISFAMDLRPQLKPDQKRQKPCFKLLLWGTAPELLIFSRSHYLFQKTREPLGWCQSGVPTHQQLQSVPQLIQGPKEVCQRGPTASSSSQPVGRPPHLLPGMM